MEQEQEALRLSQLSAIVAEVFQMHFSEARFWVTAEIIGLKQSRGHCYLQVAEKDESGTTPKAEFRANIWAGQYQRISQRFFRMTGSPLREQIQVLMLVEVKYHERYGLSLIVHDIDPAFTLGHLEREKRQTVDRLRKEGVYDLNRSLELPCSLQRIALISAEDSRGYEDFMNRLHTNPYGFTFDVVLYNALLQGDLAAGSMVSQIEAILRVHQQKPFDALAIVRGGGAASGMECFNQYVLAETLARMPIPVITGIGHHADNSVCDEIAHTVRMTPTDVANFLIEQQTFFDGTLVSYWDQVCDIARITLSDERAFIQHAAQTLVSGIRLSSTRAARSLDHAAFRLKHTTQQQVLVQGSAVEDLHQRLAREARLVTQLESAALQEGNSRLQSASSACLLAGEETLKHLEACVHLLDPAQVLRRGYSYTVFNGKTVTSFSEVHSGDTITTVLRDGTVESIIQ